MRFAAVLILFFGLQLQTAAGHTPENPAPRVSAVQVQAPGQQLELDLAALSALPARELQAGPHGEAPSRWTGVPLRELLSQVGVPAGESLRGRNLTQLVRITATDGYQVVFSLAEIDAGFAGAEVLLAYRRDGAELDADGPFRLVVPGDRRAGRWVRNVARIELLDVCADTAAIP